MKERKICTNESCNNEVLTKLGYQEECHYCWRKYLMRKSDEEIADDLTARTFKHYDDYLLREALRRLLLRET